MSDTNLAPEATGSDEALSEQGGADAILDLLPDPETDLQEDQGQDDGAPKPEAEEKSEDDLLAEAVAKEGETEKEEDGQQGDYASGKFAADTASVRLKDGTVISVQDLKRGYLSQASFTRGTQENAKERETLASLKAEVESTAQALKQQRDFLLQASQQFLPQPPDETMLDSNSPGFDPIRYMAAKADYEKKVHSLNQLHQMSQAEQARMAQEQSGQREQLRSQEAKKLLEVMPELGKPDVYQKFWSEAVETMSEYGFSAGDLNGAIDHRLYKVYRDLAAYRRARSRLTQVKDAVQSKPVLTAKKRMDPQEKSSREKQVRGEQLRKTGSFESGVNALMDLDL
ncbi:MAG: hypothetical protein AB7R40_23540 [Nitrospiraceae bacterium]